MTNWSAIKYFRPEEFTCQCGCGAADMKLHFVQTLDLLRGYFGKPLIITSGYRCPTHNNAVSSTGFDGPHTTGLAADIAISRHDAHALLVHAMKLRFTGIGVNQKGAGRFLHLDLIPEGPTRPWVWSY